MTRRHRSSDIQTNASQSSTPTSPTYTFHVHRPHAHYLFLDGVAKVRLATLHLFLTNTHLPYLLL